VASKPFLQLRFTANAVVVEEYSKGRKVKGQWLGGFRTLGEKNYGFI